MPNNKVIQTESRHVLLPKSDVRKEFQEVYMRMQSLEGTSKDHDNVNVDTRKCRRKRRGKRDKEKNVSAKGCTKHVLDFLPTPSPKAESGDRDLKTVKYKLASQRSFLGIRDDDLGSDLEMKDAADNYYFRQKETDNDPEFESVFAPSDMRLLALVSHNNMKMPMKEFVVANKNILKKFRLSGTNTTMAMLKEVFDHDPDIVYGPSCKSGPLGGDAQLVALAASGELGGCIFFMDPMDSHPHIADIDCLVRQGNVHNILMMNNPTTAHTCLDALRVALKMGRADSLPSFFFDLESPSVEAYRAKQNNILIHSQDHLSFHTERTMSTIDLSRHSHVSEKDVEDYILTRAIGIGKKKLFDTHGYNSQQKDQKGHNHTNKTKKKRYSRWRCF